MKVRFYSRTSLGWMTLVISDTPEVVQRFSFLKAGPKSNLYEVDVIDKANIKTVIQKLSKEVNV